MGGLLSKLWGNGRKRDSKESSPSKGTQDKQLLPSSLKSKNEPATISGKKVKRTGSHASNQGASDVTPTNTQVAKADLHPIPVSQPIVPTGTQSTVTSQNLAPLVPVPQLASEPPQPQITHNPDVPKTFKTTFETTIAVPKAPEETDDYEHLVQNGPAPLATIDIDTDILEHDDTSENATQPGKDTIEEAVVKIQAGVRGFLTRKQLKTQKSDSAIRPDTDTPASEIPIVPPPSEFTDESEGKEKVLSKSDSQGPSIKRQSEFEVDSEDIEVIAEPVGNSEISDPSNVSSLVQSIMTQQMDQGHLVLQSEKQEQAADDEMEKVKVILNPHDVTHAINITNYDQHSPKQVDIMKEVKSKQSVQGTSSSKLDELQISSKAEPLEVKWTKVNPCEVTNSIPVRTYEKHTPLSNLPAPAHERDEEASQFNCNDVSQLIPLVKYDQHSPIDGLAKLNANTAIDKSDVHKCNSYDVTHSITVQAYEKHTTRSPQLTKSSGEASNVADEETIAKLDNEVKQIIDSAIQEAKQITKEGAKGDSGSPVPQITCQDVSSAEDGVDLSDPNAASDLDNAAVKIQAAYRGYQVRKAISREASPINPQSGQEEGEKTDETTAADQSTSAEPPSKSSKGDDLLTECTAPEEINIWDVEGDVIETKADVFAKENVNEVVHVEAKKLEDKLLIDAEAIALDEETLPALDDKLLDLESTVPSPPTVPPPQVPPEEQKKEITLEGPPENLVESSINLSSTPEQGASSEDTQAQVSVKVEVETTEDQPSESGETGERRDSNGGDNGNGDVPSSAAFGRGTSPNPAGKKKRKGKGKKK